jgi:hypothetical protein
MKDRVTRFGLSGLTFIVSCVFGYWLLGGEISFSQLPFKKYLISSLVAFASTPAFGFVLSSIIVGFLKLVFSQKVEFLKPNPKSSYYEDYCKKILCRYETLDSGVGITAKSGVVNFEIENFDLLFICHQVLFRNCGNSEAIGFSTRRMDLYWSQLNTFFSITFGSLVGMLIFSHECNFIFGDFDIYKSLCIIPIILYLTLSLHQACKAKKESNDFEKMYIVKFL